jgi:hypothetical protein
VHSCLVKAYVRRLAVKVPRGDNRIRLQLDKGAVVNGFRVKSVTPIPDFESTAYSMVHERTGAEYLHVDRADTNNVFGVLFRTRAGEQLWSSTHSRAYNALREREVPNQRPVFQHDQA